jgi:hypothetical protein
LEKNNGFSCVIDGSENIYDSTFYLSKHRADADKQRISYCSQELRQVSVMANDLQIGRRLGYYFFLRCCKAYRLPSTQISLAKAL